MGSSSCVPSGWALGKTGLDGQAVWGRAEERRPQRVSWHRDQAAHAGSILGLETVSASLGDSAPGACRPLVTQILPTSGLFLVQSLPRATCTHGPQ